MGSPADEYDATRRRIGELLQGLDDEALDTPVPACPDWRVRDMVAHLAGVAEDIATGNLEGAATDPWTAAQIERAEGSSVEELLAAWETAASGLADKLEGDMAPIAPILLADATSHELDIRSALGDTSHRDSPGVSMSVGRMIQGGLGRGVGTERLAPIQVRWDGLEAVVGEGEPAATVEGDPFTLLRAMTGRRNADQVRVLFTSGDPEPYLPHFAIFAMREDPLEE